MSLGNHPEWVQGGPPEYKTAGQDVLHAPTDSHDRHALWGNGGAHDPTKSAENAPDDENWNWI